MNRDSTLGGPDPNCSVLLLEGLVPPHPAPHWLFLSHQIISRFISCQGHCELHIADWTQALCSLLPRVQAPPQAPKHCPENTFLSALEPWVHATVSKQNAASDMCQLPSLLKVVPGVGACDDGCFQYFGQSH